uniref:Putative secreted protein n=1 Tax=Anopheles darlingi TaxID=43151 RepID=A0A2M4DDH5_ANODA
MRECVCVLCVTRMRKRLLVLLLLLLLLLPSIQLVIIPAMVSFLSSLNVLKNRWKLHTVQGQGTWFNNIAYWGPQCAFQILVAPQRGTTTNSGIN